jgi:hypothetical protein
MPLSFGIPLGMAILAVGAVLFFATSYKQAAKVVLAIGAAILLLTSLLIGLALMSPM